MRISTTLAEVDAVCDYIPVISTVSNLIDLFLKCVCKEFSLDTVESRYWTYISEKDISRCFILLIPIIGNLYILFKDYIEFKNDGEKATHADFVKSEVSFFAEYGNISDDMLTSANTSGQIKLWKDCLQNKDSRLKISPNFYHYGTTPLVIACRTSSVDTVRPLIKNKEDATFPDLFGNTPFAMASALGDLETVQLLRLYVDNINAPDSNGFTPVTLAAFYGRRTTVNYLVEQGADPAKASKEGIDAYVAAIINDHDTILASLLVDYKGIDDDKYSLAKMKSLIQLPLQKNLPFICADILGEATDSEEDVDHLLAFQAELNGINPQKAENLSAFGLAVALKKPRAALTLLQAGAAFSEDESVLAAKNNLVEVVDYIYQISKVKMGMTLQAPKNDDNPSDPTPLEMGLREIKTILRYRAEDAKTLSDLGPFPKTGMQLIFN